MDIGKSGRIGTEAYVKALEKAGLAGDAAKLRQIFSKYNLGEEASFYQGPKAKDGNILVSYRASAVTNGFLRFSENGVVYDTIAEKQIETLSQRAARFFIAGVFGKEELTNSIDWVEDMILSGILGASGCYVIDSEQRCSYDGIERSVAEAEKKQRDKKEESEKEEMAGYINRGDAIWERAEKLIKLAEKEEGIMPWSIDPDDLRDIYNQGAGARPNFWRPQNLHEARQYAEHAESVFEKMLRDSSGYKTVEERGREIGCKYVEHVTSGPYCSGNESSVSGWYEGVSCNPDTSVTIVSRSGFCSQPRSEPADRGR